MARNTTKTAAGEAEAETETQTGLAADEAAPPPRPPRHPIAQAAMDKAAAEGHGAMKQRQAGEKALQAAGEPTTPAGRQAKAEQEAHRAELARKKAEKAKAGGE